MLTDEQVGRNLARLRGDMSQKDLALLMRERGFKWSQATVWSVEKGERPLRLVESEAIANCFGVHTGHLTGQEPQTYAMSLARAARQADGELRKAITDYDDVRFQLAIALDRVPAEQMINAVHAGTGWVERGANDVVDEVHRDVEAQNVAESDGMPAGRQLTGRWLEVWGKNSTPRE